MIEPLENLYFNWLYAQVSKESGPGLPMKEQMLLAELHRHEFVWLVTGDDNRAEEGQLLRKEFLKETNFDVDDYWLNEPPSVLEVLVAFSRIASFETEERSRDWFWIMLDNLNLSSDGDHFDRIEVHDILERFVWRTYTRKGYGGLFPLRKSKNDQRKVEIWYQFNEYLYEQHYLVG